ncbi:hypothetical protein BAU15_12730 [Enterococcus sp. JM4C]|uniref:AGE family epimerase/isomerase n=1 Tax=Candidatus Enterococcus huntleyi TaxID=1857217 RepID=UPI001379C05E|nr:AGE family epimerase/isomerase [Enterococcus sp. JM4C]KAF1296415.1 hypothetical protein BAU15_12730 [Enterococcus sp. JM4C]
MKQKELRDQLTQTILPFWLAQKDQQYGGFISEVNQDLKQLPQEPKNSVMQSRYLWAFSAASQLTPSPELQAACAHGFSFLKSSFWDSEFGGVYWQVSYDGEVTKDKKVLYAQSFALYSLSEYYKATKTEPALTLAKELFELIEKHAFRQDGAGYNEEFSRDWQEIPIHEVGTAVDDLTFTTNTHLHLFEAYTVLYEIWPNQKLLEKIRFLMDLFRTKIIQKDGYCRQFFSNTWQPLTTEISYGHDIETSWLLDRGQSVIRTNQLDAEIIHLATYALENGLDTQGLMNDSSKNLSIDQTKVWWVQAEALIGFYNAYQKTQDDRFIQAAERLWQAIQTYFIDPRKASEWLAYLSAETPTKLSKRHSTSISDNWKGPYHTVRMYLEIIKRMEQDR